MNRIFIVLMLIGICSCSSPKDTASDSLGATPVGSESVAARVEAPGLMEDDSLFPSLRLREYPEITDDSVSSLFSQEELETVYGTKGTLTLSREGKTWKFAWKGEDSKAGEILVSIQQISEDQVAMEVASRNATASVEARLEELDLPGLGVKSYWNPASRFQELEVFTARKRLTITTGLMYSSRSTPIDVTKKAAIEIAKLLLRTRQ